jgi:hypothetical protein
MLKPYPAPVNRVRIPPPRWRALVPGSVVYWNDRAVLVNSVAEAREAGIPDDAHHLLRVVSVSFRYGLDSRKFRGCVVGLIVHRCGTFDRVIVSADDSVEAFRLHNQGHSSKAAREARRLVFEVIFGDWDGASDFRRKFSESS